MATLCDILADKYELGVKTRAAYKANDKAELARLANEEYARVESNLRAFIKAFEKQWMKENKPQGFDVQDIRLGGMIIRTEHCIKRLKDYLSGKIDRIEELEDTPLEYYGNGEEAIREDTTLNSFKKIFTSNTLTW